MYNRAKKTSTRRYSKPFFASAIQAFTLILLVSLGSFAQAGHPKLVVTEKDIQAMILELEGSGGFKDSYLKVKQHVDSEMKSPMSVPYPKDAGGGYTHEKHKSNYRLMHDAGLMYQLTGEKHYADYVRDMLFKYAEMYSGLPLHPERKSLSPGKLFWQGLNEAVWLVYTIQAYDFIAPALTDKEKTRIEDELFREVVQFIADDSPQTFDRIHNHGTWATAGVGMTGFVLGDQDMVDKSQLGLDKSGKGGFLRQMDELFSPEGYYNEGPYYQRYAMMPFLLYAKSIEVNQPEKQIFKARDGILLKAIDTTIQLSYNGLFFPLNDAIKDKGIDTIEMVYGVSMAYGLTGDPAWLSIAKRQDQILLTGDGLAVARALDANKQIPYEFRSTSYGDGAKGTDGALVLLRDGDDLSGSAVVFKATSQGLGHGHFDKLNWQLYDNGNEIVSDYGAARFLNVVAKSGGRYLKENKSYAKQSVAHNTLVVDERTHFNGNLKVANANHPELVFFDASENVKIASAGIDTAYKGVGMRRTMAMVKLDELEAPLVVDILSANSKTPHQYDVPLHYKGQLIDFNFDVETHSTLSALGKAAGYQHLWLRGEGTPKAEKIRLTWLNKGRFYTSTTVNKAPMKVLFTQLGANDPNFNLVTEDAFIIRSENVARQDFVSVLESHGEYNPSKEYTLNSVGKVSAVLHKQDKGLDLVELQLSTGERYLLAVVAAAKPSKKMASKKHSFRYEKKKLTFKGPYKLFKL